MALDERIRAKRGEILALAAKHDVRNVRIFGSAGQGEASPESDVDVLAELYPGRKPL